MNSDNLEQSSKLLEQSYKNKYVDLRSTYLKLFDGLENPKDFPTSNKNKYINLRLNNLKLFDGLDGYNSNNDLINIMSGGGRRYFKKKFSKQFVAPGAAAALPENNGKLFYFMGKIKQLPILSDIEEFRYYLVNNKIGINPKKDNINYHITLLELEFNNSYKPDDRKRDLYTFNKQNKTYSINELFIENINKLFFEFFDRKKIYLEADKFIKIGHNPDIDDNHIAIEFKIIPSKEDPDVNSYIQQYNRLIFNEIREIFNVDEKKYTIDKVIKDNYAYYKFRNSNLKPVYEEDADMFVVPNYYIDIWKPHISLTKIGALRYTNPILYSEIIANSDNIDKLNEIIYDKYFTYSQGKILTDLVIILSDSIKRIDIT
jgi:hypothetical protein